MKKVFLFLGLGMALLTNAQDKKSNFEVGTDIVSRYVWRGTDFGNSPVVQPGLTFNAGAFSLGAWGSYSTNTDAGADEGDLFASYSLSTGTNLMVTDYFFPAVENDYFDYDNHFLELGISQSIKAFYISGYYIAVNGMNDLYFEGGYEKGNVVVFLGGGNEAYTPDDNGDFNICNVGITVTKSLQFTEQFEIPLFGSLIYNPSAKGVHIVAGISL